MRWSSLLLTAIAAAYWTHASAAPSSSDPPQTAAVQSSAPIRINCGGPAYTGSSGESWLADIYFSGGRIATYTDSVSSTSNPTLYQTERYGNTVTYSMPVNNGSYLVNLYFAEMYFNAAGQRVFNVTVEGQSVLSNFDIFATLGARTAGVYSVVANVTDAKLDIAATATTNFAKFSAIEVLSNTSPTPTATPKPTPTPTATPTPSPTPTPGMTGSYIYAAQDDGTIRVYDINQSHALVKKIRFFAGKCDARGIAAAAPTHRLYLMYNTPGKGHVLCIDLLNDQVQWDRVIHTAVDRGDVTPNGKTLYVPSYEGLNNSPFAFVVDAASGNVISTIEMPIKTHDAICSLDGTKVFMGNKSDDESIRTISTTNNQVIAVSDKFGGIMQPFAVNNRNNLVVANVVGVYGFQYADLKTGRILGTAGFVGTKWQDSGVPDPHGIGITPNEKEAWVCDRGRGNHFVHVFDITALPPVQKQLVDVSNDNPNWLTFTIDGRYCYVAGVKDTGRKTDIIDVAAHSKIGQLPYASEEMLEVDYQSGVVSAVGNQAGIGRANGPIPTPSPTATPKPTATPTPKPSPARVRIAVDQDGNYHDRDDISDTAISAAILSKGGRSQDFVFWSYADHYWLSRPNWETDLQASVSGGVNRFGPFPNLQIYNATSNRAAAVGALRDQINASSANNQLHILANGPMQIVGEAIAASTPGARQFVTVFSQSNWNDNHAKIYGPSEGLAPPYYIFDQFAGMGVNVKHFQDGDINLQTTKSKFYWLRDSSDSNLQWIYSRNEVAFPAPNTRYDCSGAALEYYEVTGDGDATPGKLQTLLNKP